MVIGRNFSHMILQKKRKKNFSTYLFLRPIPHDHTMTTVDQIFHDTATHDAEPEETKFQSRWKDILLSESLRHCFDV